MELWREVLISGLQNENYEFNFVSDMVLKNVIESKSYEILLQIKQLIEDKKLSDENCFIKIEEILCKLEENHIFCDRHDFG